MGIEQEVSEQSVFYPHDSGAVGPVVIDISPWNDMPTYRSLIREGYRFHSNLPYMKGKYDIEAVSSRVRKLRKQGLEVVVHDKAFSMYHVRMKGVGAIFTRKPVKKRK